VGHRRFGSVIMETLNRCVSRVSWALFLSIDKAGVKSIGEITEGRKHIEFENYADRSTF
jgi:hypothetical protein